MNTDAFFTTGKQHNVCQDYALAQSGLILLSDGCSSSPHTDVGSRLICHMAQIHGPADGVAQARLLLEVLALPDETLDATLLSARWDPTSRSVQVTVHGDGVVVARRRDGTRLIISTSYPSGAPLYPNYDLDRSRRDRYATEFGTRQVVTSYDGDDVSEKEVVILGPEGWGSPVTSYGFNADQFDLVLLFSDGALSFRKPVGTSGMTEAVPLPVVVDEMLAIKGFVGEFLTRRAKRFLKDVAAKGWHHDDDFSVAGMYLGAEVSNG